MKYENLEISQDADHTKIQRVLILGGTDDAHALASLLSGRLHYRVMTSLAGRTGNPTLPAGQTRIGGFGGVEGLRTYIKREGFDIIVDATHPFAAKMSANVVEALDGLDLKFCRLERAAWEAVSGDDWHHAESVEDAAQMIAPGAKALVTIGRQKLAPFLERTDISGVARMIEAPFDALPDHWSLLLQRPPFALSNEVGLLKNNNIDVLVTKNSGGAQTRAKLHAARTCRLPVIMIDRPKKSKGDVFESAEDVVTWLAE